MVTALLKGKQPPTPPNPPTHPPTSVNLFTVPLAVKHKKRIRHRFPAECRIWLCCSVWGGRVRLVNAMSDTLGAALNWRLEANHDVMHAAAIAVSTSRSNRGLFIRFCCKCNVAASKVPADLTPIYTVYCKMYCFNFQSSLSCTSNTPSTSFINTVAQVKEPLLRRWWRRNNIISAYYVMGFYGTWCKMYIGSLCDFVDANKYECWFLYNKNSLITLRCLKKKNNKQWFSSVEWGGYWSLVPPITLSSVVFYYISSGKSHHLLLYLS